MSLFNLDDNLKSLKQARHVRSLAPLSKTADHHHLFDDVLKSESRSKIEGERRVEYQIPDFSDAVSAVDLNIMIGKTSASSSS